MALFSKYVSKNRHEATSQAPTCGHAVSAELLATIAILIALIALSRTFSHKGGRPNKKFSKQLIYSSPITPNHNPPKTMGDLVDDHDLRFFRDFAEFGLVVNWWLADEDIGGRWRLQELPESDLRLDGSDMPSFGRRYDVFHNQARLGTVEISAGLDYSERRNVWVDVALEYVRLLPFDTVAGFLGDVALHVCNQDRSTKEYIEAQQSIAAALSRALWDAQRIHQEDLGEDWGELELRVAGTADWYFTRRDALRRKDAR